MKKSEMWTYHNPVAVTFGLGCFDRIAILVAARPYLLVTYPDAHFAVLASRLAELLGPPAGMVSDVSPDPDIVDLARQSSGIAMLETQPEVVLALGGGSVIDSAKVLAASAEGFATVETLLDGGKPSSGWNPLPLIAVPTTAGTGSEVTCWATVWDRKASIKRSLEYPMLYPEAAVIDPHLMHSMPCALTVSTGLDALSHALESLWNRNVNSITATHAVAAARVILEALPALVADPENLDSRSRMAAASLSAGLAFSCTRTAIAHAISYPVTLRYGVPHGIACSFTLPMILDSLAEIEGLTGQGLREIFGPDLRVGARRLADTLDQLGVGLDPADYGIDTEEWAAIFNEATVGARGRNFIGTVRRPLQPLPPFAS
ncbi:iron-containing alcohol dehydrogenase PsrA [Desulfobulbus alkaliphilus]|uniref:iron-containing alcohol dehydrogenase PsrA n=1 Tax=Desulfobulbus alkaliphilus TaxID=869814 RepID=UPI0019634117|nr:iron-containing alcohol dehydrogenase PsrA [Desulfobulbus alkaliphilus]MBM9536104.1 phosphonoacetaldehyde reductase [Desulfobulbus alkaliphilus]